MGLLEGLVLGAALVDFLGDPRCQTKSTSPQLRGLTHLDDQCHRRRLEGAGGETKTKRNLKPENLKWK